MYIQYMTYDITCTCIITCTSVPSTEKKKIAGWYQIYKEKRDKCTDVCNE